MDNKLQKLAGLQAGGSLDASGGGAGGLPREDLPRQTKMQSDDNSVLASCPLCVAPIALDKDAGRQTVFCKKCGLRCELAPPAPAAPPMIQLPMVESEPEPIDEFQRWLAGKPITVRPRGRLERLQQWRREQPALAMLSAGALMLLGCVTLAALGASAWLVVQLNLQERRAATRAELAEQTRAGLERQILIARSSTLAAEARFAQAQREVQLAHASHLAWRSTQLDETDPKQSVHLATQSLTIAMDAAAHPPALAHQQLRRFVADDGKLLRGHTADLTALAASDDGRWLASASNDATVRLWPLSEQAPSRSGILLSGHLGSVVSLAFTSDGRWLASAGDDSTVRFWDLAAANPTFAPWVLRAKASQLTAVAVSPDNRWAAVAARGAAGEESTLRVWDLSADDAAILSIEATSRDGAIGSLAISPDSRWLLTAGARGIARLWKLTGERPLASSIALSNHSGAIHEAGFTPGGWLVAAGSADDSGNAVYVWALDGDTPSAPVVLGGYAGDVRSIDISRDGRWLATGGDDSTVRVWDLRAQNPAACGVTLEGHAGPVGVVKISPDGRWLISGGQDRTVRLWSMTQNGPDSTSVVLRKHAQQVSALAISGDGNWFASAADDELRLWTLQLDQLMAQAQQRTIDSGPVLAKQPAEHIAAAKPALPAAISSLPPVPADDEPQLPIDPADGADVETEWMTDFSTFLR